MPFAVFVLLLQPSLLYALYHPLGEAPGSYWAEFLGAEGQLDTGPLWFVGALLIFSFGYVAGAQALRKRPAERRLGALTAAHLLLLVAAVAPATFLIRLVYPFGGDSGFTDLNLWEWPACIALSGLGTDQS